MFASWIQKPNIMGVFETRIWLGNAAFLKFTATKSWELGHLKAPKIVHLLLVWMQWPISPVQLLTTCLTLALALSPLAVWEVR